MFSLWKICHIFSREWEGKGRVEGVRRENFREPGREAEGTVCAMSAGGTQVRAPCP